MKKQIKIKATNKYIHGKRLDTINNFLHDRFWCQAVFNDEGELLTEDPKASTVIRMDYELVVECEDSDAAAVVSFIGKEVSELEKDGPMNRDKALIELRKLQKSHDTEVAHSSADWVLCELLKTLGFEDVVHEYHQVDKWYS